MSRFRQIQEAIEGLAFSIRGGSLQTEGEISDPNGSGKVVAIVSQVCDIKGKDIRIAYKTGYQDVMGGEYV